MIEESPGIEAGILKIHRNHEAVNKRLRSAQAKAVLTHRNMRDACFSYWRMLNNRNSPFYRDNPSRDILQTYIRTEIDSFAEKARQPNTLLVREEDLQDNPEAAIGRICQFLGIEINASSLQFLSHYLSRAGMRALAERGAGRRNSTGHESITYLHLDHITAHGSEPSCSADIKRAVEDLLMSEFAGDLCGTFHIRPKAEQSLNA